MITIREATEADVERVLEMSCLFLALTPYGRLVQPTYQSLLTLIGVVMANGVILLADAHGHTVGMLAIANFPHPLTGEPYADEVAWWVDPEHRKGRAGFYLLRACEDWARQNGLSMIKMVAPFGTDIGKFYERLGYVPVETAYQKTLKE